MDFISGRSVNSTATSSDAGDGDNTATFIIGFGILLIFVILGILASIFLCITLKKDAYLWEAQEAERRTSKKSTTQEVPPESKEESDGGGENAIKSSQDV